MQNKKEDSDTVSKLKDNASALVKKFLGGDYGKGKINKGTNFLKTMIDGIKPTVQEINKTYTPEKKKKEKKKEEKKKKPIELNPDGLLGGFSTRQKKQKQMLEDAGKY